MSFSEPSQTENQQANDFKDQLKNWFNSKSGIYAVATLISINAIILGLLTIQNMSESIRSTLEVFEFIILAIFVVEIGLRIYANGWSYFKGGWNWFDFILVSFTLLVLIFQDLIPGGDSVVIFRILRLLRIISIFKSLRTIMESLVAALPGMRAILIILVLMIYMFAVMGTMLYGETFPKFFGSVPKSAFSLFQIMTFDAWTDSIVRPIMAKHSFAWLYFLSFILMTALVILNLLLGVIVASVEHETHKDDTEEQHQIKGDTKELLSQMKKMNEELTGIRIKVEKLEQQDTNAYK